MHNTMITLTSLLLVQWVHAKEFLIKKFDWKDIVEAAQF